MQRFWIAVLAAVVSLNVPDSRADGPFRFEFAEIAEDVWVGIRPDSSRFPVMGNVTFVVSDEGVVVFDGGGMPLMTEQVIAKIRSLTDLPVTDVVISHWHGDHSFGIVRLTEAFPNLRIIAHTFTDDMMHSRRLSYIDRERSFIENSSDEFQAIVATGVGTDGEEYSDRERAFYARILNDADVIDEQFNRARLTPPTHTFSDVMRIQSGRFNIELRFLGPANTAGDIVMWLPEQKIVATGDMVVLPTPYAFNVPPAAWAKTLRALNALGYETLVPGHGAVQTDTRYVDLLIASAESIAQQRDRLLADNVPLDELADRLDFSAFEDEFLQGDEGRRDVYEAWFVKQLGLAAVKEVRGEPMVPVEKGEVIGFDDERWQFDATESSVEEYLGQPALKLRGGSAMLPDLQVRNAMVEFDIAIGDQRGFGGLRFRAQDNANFEHFYLRPHQSGNPDANQYTPVFNGVSAWQLYHGDGYAVPLVYRQNAWMPVKVVFAGDQARVTVDGQKVVLAVTDLKHGDIAGAIGLDAADFTAMHFANFRVTELPDAYQFPYVPAAERPDGVVASWQISEPFDSRELNGVVDLRLSSESELSWAPLAAENSGLANIARLHGIDEGKDTVFARFVMSMGEAQTREMRFGYSDSARVYVNGELVYTGDNGYRSRDYRYLGTIGYFDSVPLRLEPGDNEIWIAVTEQFGGWGVMAQIGAPAQ